MIETLAAATRGNVRGEPARVASALKIALEEGAYDTGGFLAEHLLSRLRDLGDRLRGLALPLILELLVALGERARASAIAEAHARTLEASPHGAGLLDLLGCPGSRGEPRLVLPRGRLNAVAMCRLIDHGRLSHEELVRLFLDHPVALLRAPQLHLLLHRACRDQDRSLAVAALNRFLRAQGLPKCEVHGSSGHLLRDVSFPKLRASGSRPLVSVVVSAHDASDTIAYAIDSILNQTYRNLEVLVCDDGSVDGTHDLLVRNYGSHPRVRIFSSVRNQGTYNVRNRLLELARGDLLTFHDADDLALPTRIETQVRQVRDGRAAACVTSWTRVMPDGRFVFFRDQSAIRLALVSLLASRDVFAGLGPFRRVRFGADFEAYRALSDRYGSHHIARVRAPMILGLWAGTSLTRREGSEALEDGYRAPGRRVYSELVFRQRLLGKRVVSDAQLTEALRESGNYLEPQRIIEHEQGAGEASPVRSGEASSR